MQLNAVECKFGCVWRRVTCPPNGPRCALTCSPRRAPSVCPPTAALPYGMVLNVEGSQCRGMMFSAMVCSGAQFNGTDSTRRYSAHGTIHTTIHTTTHTMERVQHLRQVRKDLFSSIVSMNHIHCLSCCC